MEDNPREVYQDTSLAVDTAKQACGIITPNSLMTDEEIRTVCKWIAQQAPDTVWVDSKPVFGRMGTDVMLFIALTEFPRFYEEYGLSQFN